MLVTVIMMTTDRAQKYGATALAGHQGEGGGCEVDGGREVWGVGSED